MKPDLRLVESENHLAKESFVKPVDWYTRGIKRCEQLLPYHELFQLFSALVSHDEAAAYRRWESEGSKGELEDYHGYYAELQNAKEHLDILKDIIEKNALEDWP